MIRLVLLASVLLCGRVYAQSSRTVQDFYRAAESSDLAAFRGTLAESSVERLGTPESLAHVRSVLFSTELPTEIGPMRGLSFSEQIAGGSRIVRMLDQAMFVRSDDPLTAVAAAMVECELTYRRRARPPRWELTSRHCGVTEFIPANGQVAERVGS